jgi:hypothetical protein
LGAEPADPPRRVPSVVRPVSRGDVLAA